MKLQLLSQVRSVLSVLEMRQWKRPLDLSIQEGLVTDMIAKWLRQFYNHLEDQISLEVFITQAL